MFRKMNKMNSSKKLGLAFLIISLTGALTACGEQHHYLAANVSLGGSGAGTQKPRPGGSDLPGHGKDDEDNYEYYMTIPETVTDECLGVQRTMRFIHADSKQPILSGTEQLLSATPLQIELRNTTPNYIYERVPQCRQMEVWSELTSVHIQSDQYLRCPSEQDSIQVLRPYETRIYEFDAKLPNDADRWKMKYTAANYSIQLPTNDLEWIRCKPLEITIPVDKIFKPKKPIDNSEKLEEEISLPEDIVEQPIEETKVTTKVGQLVHK